MVDAVGASADMIALAPALERLAGALAPGGTPAVLGPYREEGWADLATSLAAWGQASACAAC